MTLSAKSMCFSAKKIIVSTSLNLHKMTMGINPLKKLKGGNTMAVFTNQATLTYNNTTTNSNIVTGEIIEVLSATKSSLQTEYGNNDTVTYLVNIVNSGATAISGVSVTDDLGAFTLDDQTTSVVPLDYIDGSVRVYANGVLQAAPTVVAGPPLEITGITVPANGNVLVAYQARANEFAPLATGSTIVNTATVDAATITTPIEVSNTLAVQDSANLTITKSISPSTVVENGRVTYTFVIQNTGNTPADAADVVSVTDTFDPILSDLAVTFNATAWTEPANYTYDEATGLFTTLAGQITVPAATYVRDETTGAISINPGISILTVTGTV